VEDTMRRCALYDLLDDKDFFGEALDFANQEVGKGKHQFSALQAIEVLKPYLDAQPKMKDKLRDVSDPKLREDIVAGFATLIIMRGIHMKYLIFWE
jgi:hypothetical protein